MNDIITVSNIKKDYYTKKGIINAIDDISFSFKENTFTSIIGSSGCGKSTLLNIIFNLEKPTSGSVLYDKNLKIGYMLQEDALLPWLTVFENATLPLKINKQNTKENINYVNNLLTKYGLKDFINKYPSELSGGMKQRVALIRTLSTKPDVLLLDEAFSALDYQSRLNVSSDVHKIIKNENKTVIMITHDIAEAISLSDTIIVLSKRPSKIKNVYELNFQNEDPIERRKDSLFNEYYNILWRDLDGI